MDTKQYWGEVYQESLAEVRKIFGVKGGAMKLAAGVIITALALGMSFWFGWTQGVKEATKIIAGIFLTDIIIICALWVSTPVFAFIKMFGVAAKRDAKQQKKIGALTQQPKKAKLRLVKTDNPQDNVPYISVLVSNRESVTAKCHAVLTKIKVDGKEDKVLFQYVTKDTPRISWAGGTEEEIGVKYIDPGVNTGTLNIATFKNIDAMVFDMAKGARGNRLKLGRYDIIVELRGTINDDSFKKIHKTISFEYYDSGEQFTEEIGQGLTLKGRERKRNIRLIKKDKK